MSCKKDNRYFITLPVTKTIRTEFDCPFCQLRALMDAYDKIQQKDSTIPNKLLCFGVKNPSLFLRVYKAT